MSDRSAAQSNASRDSDHAPGLERLFAVAPPEGDREVAVAGDLPTFVRGSYYAIGPARFAVGGMRYGHWLDGDGLVLAVHIAGDTARVVHRYVEGTKQRDEAAAGRALYRAFGTAWEGDRLRRGLGLESPTNVAVHPWCGALLAYGEQALPWRLDPVTLETLGEHDFGRLSPASPLSAHACIDRATGEMANFGIGFSPARPTLTYYRFAADGGLAVRARHAIDRPVSVHDFAVSARFAVFDLAPYVLDFDVFRGGATLLEALAWRPELGRSMLVLERHTGAEVARISMPAGYCLHLVDAWDDGAALVVEMIEMEEPVYDQYRLDDLFPDVRPSYAVRYRLDPAAGRVLARRALDGETMCDFPVTDPRCTGSGCTGFYASAISRSGSAGRKFFDRLVRLDWQRGSEADAWQAPIGTYLAGEAGFVPAPGEPAAGAIVVPVVEPATETGLMLAFDAGNLAQGPIARIGLPAMLPPLFHAWFEPERAGNPA